MISIIVPFYNEEKTVNVFVKELYKIISKINKTTFEVLFVNDGSLDNTLVLLKKVMKIHKEIRVISFSRNFGHEAAVNAGICCCSGDAAIIMDADLQDPPLCIPKLIKKFYEGYDVVNVKRIDRSNDSFFKRKTAKLFYRIIKRWAYKIKIEENVNNFRLISRKVIDVVKKFDSKNKVFRFEVPFAGFKTTYIELVRPKRVDGKSHYNLSAMSKLAIDSFVSTTIQPLNLITKLFLGFVFLFFLSGVSELTLYLIQRFGTPLYISKFAFLTWLICNVSLFFTCLIMFSISIIGQYIARIHLETQNRPMYIIEDIFENKND